MKSLERRFRNISENNPHWSSYVCFAEAIWGQKFCKKIIKKYFNKLVERDDYEKRDKKQIIKFLVSLTEAFKKDS
jgi:predicted RNA-binding protein YlxR (DUF448 family)